MLSRSIGANNNVAYLKRINFCGAKTIAKFVDFHNFAKIFPVTVRKGFHYSLLQQLTDNR